MHYLRIVRPRPRDVLPKILRSMAKVAMSKIGQVDIAGDLSQIHY